MPRKEPTKSGNEISDGLNMKNFYKPWKEDAHVDESLMLEEYED